MRELENMTLNPEIDLSEHQFTSQEVNLKGHKFITPEIALPEHLKLVHEKALALSNNYKQTEAELLDIIIQVREHKIYRYFACTSVFSYCVQILKLDAGLVYGFTAVAKKIKEVPELKE